MRESIYYKASKRRLLTLKGQNEDKKNMQIKVNHEAMKVNYEENEDFFQLSRTT